MPPCRLAELAASVAAYSLCCDKELLIVLLRIVSTMSMITCRHGGSSYTHDSTSSLPPIRRQPLWLHDVQLLYPTPVQKLCGQIEAPSDFSSFWSYDGLIGMGLSRYE